MSCNRGKSVSGRHKQTSSVNATRCNPFGPAVLDLTIIGPLAVATFIPLRSSVAFTVGAPGPVKSPSSCRSCPERPCKTGDRIAGCLCWRSGCGFAQTRGQFFPVFRVLGSVSCHTSIFSPSVTPASTAARSSASSGRIRLAWSSPTNRLTKSYP